MSQVFPALLRENGAEGVSIAMNVMIPNGITQAALPVIAGYMRDKGVPLRYLMAFAQANAAVRGMSRELTDFPLL